jgi:hypothetical protein
MLICKFASPDSDPDRIRGWVDYLAQLARKHGDDAEATLTLRELMAQAEDWLTERVGREPGDTRTA